MSAKDKTPTIVSDDVGNFLAKVASTPTPAKKKELGRLIFAMDATASRQPTWDTACQLQGEMFSATAALGGLDVQLCYYRGFNEFHSSRWCTSAQDLLGEMSAATCLGGHTQIRKVLQHLKDENSRQRIQAGVFVGDAMEENPDQLCHLAGQLGVLNIPVFVFQEGTNPMVRSVFEQIATLSGGAYAPFNLASADQLKQLLSAVAVFAAGGRRALSHFSKSHEGVKLLLEQLKD